MSDLPKLELAHTLMSEDDALRFLEGHRISRGGRTMDPKAQIVGEFVKSIRVPGYFPPLPELRQQLRTMVSLMDEPAPSLARVEDIRIPGPAGTLPARVYDAEEDMLGGLERGEIQRGDVVVIRYEGPRGGPGMPEMLTPTSAIMGAGMGDAVALITDGRFSGGSHGFLVGHITPEAQTGGPIAFVRSGDVITIDARRRTIDVEVPAEEIAARRAAWQPPPPRVMRGVLAKYVRSVRSASEGCVTDE